MGMHPQKLDQIHVSQWVIGRDLVYAPDPWRCLVGFRLAQLRKLSNLDQPKPGSTKLIGKFSLQCIKANSIPNLWLGGMYACTLPLCTSLPCLSLCL